MMLYFSPDNAIGYLKVLDGANREYYKGVTLQYIYEFVLNKKFSKKEIINYIIIAHTNKRLRSLFCNDVKNVVIHIISGYHNYNKGKRYGYSNNQKSEYKYFINTLNRFKNEN